MAWACAEVNCDVLRPDACIFTVQLIQFTAHHHHPSSHLPPPSPISLPISLPQDAPSDLTPKIPETTDRSLKPAPTITILQIYRHPNPNPNTNVVDPKHWPPQLQEPVSAVNHGSLTGHRHFWYMYDRGVKVACACHHITITPGTICLRRQSLSSIHCSQPFRPTSAKKTHTKSASKSAYPPSPGEPI